MKYAGFHDGSICNSKTLALANLGMTFVLSKTPPPSFLRFFSLPLNQFKLKMFWTSRDRAPLARACAVSIG